MVEKKVIKRRHKDILNFCKRYMSEKGFPPSVREIGDGIGLKSTSSTCHYMQEMREMGLIISGPEFSPRAFTLPGRSMYLMMTWKEALRHDSESRKYNLEEKIAKAIRKAEKAE